MNRYAIIPATHAHCRALVLTLRPEDRAEVDSAGIPARHLVAQLYRGSYRRETAVVDGEVAAVWGMRGSLIGTSVEMWLMTTPAVARLPIAFFREARRILAEVLETKHVVVSRCGAEYHAAIRFFRMLGFDIGAPTLSDQGTVREMRLRRHSVDALRHSAAIPSTHAPPFIIYSLGRSRTAWLSAFLTYENWTCYHEHAQTLRTPGDLREFLNRPRTGTAETTSAQAWRLIRHYRPDIRSVVIKRPIEDALAAFVRAGKPYGIAYDEPTLRKNLEYGDRCLDQISAMPGTLTLAYGDLDTEAGARAVFEHCLPYAFDREWWWSLAGKNIQVNFPAFFAYYRQHRDEIEAFKHACRAELSRLRRAGEIVRHVA
jgi:hypothetical protein